MKCNLIISQRHIRRQPLSETLSSKKLSVHVTEQKKHDVITHDMTIMQKLLNLIRIGLCIQRSC